MCSIFIGLNQISRPTIGGFYRVVAVAAVLQEHNVLLPCLRGVCVAIHCALVHNILCHIIKILRLRLSGHVALALCAHTLEKNKF